MIMANDIIIGSQAITLEDAVKLNPDDIAVSGTIPFFCKGRDAARNTVLREPIVALLQIRKHKGCDSVSLDVNCRYAGGGHGNYCSTSDKNFSQKIVCPYSIDLPYALDLQY